MRTCEEWKSVFCLEGLWENDLRQKSSVEPVLELLCKQYQKFDFIRKECATNGEFEFFLSKWQQKRYAKYSILYLAFHGNPGEIILADKKVSLEKIGEKLEGRCSNKFIIFSSCSTLNIDDSRLLNFLNRTGALAVCGYQSDVDWVRSVALDLLMIEMLQYYEFSGRGMRGISSQIKIFSEQFSDLKLTLLYKRSDDRIMRIP